MPELPEVEITTRGLRKKVVGLKIKDVWTDLNTKDKRQKDTVASVKYFNFFKKEITNKKILSVERRGKNILVNISGEKTILIHLKMTGHLLYGKYKFVKNKWTPVKKGPLCDPFNRFVHIIFTFSNNHHLAFSDARKFGKITLLDTETAHYSKHLNNIGPEPLIKKFTLRKLKKQLSKKPNGKIKTILMNQSIIAGIGNIYSDEILWCISMHPERLVSKIKEIEFKLMLNTIKTILKRGITLGGDSMSDYRNIDGLSGKFQTRHKVYKRTGEKCKKRNCKGVIKRKVLNGRSAHFCSTHQK